jgi:hypothetical protein
MKENKKKEDYRCSFVNLGSEYGDDSIIHANDEQNSSFYRKLDNSLDISNSMNIINLNSNHNPHFNLSVIKENFEDLPLQISSFDKIKVKSVIPHLIVEDKGEKKD